MRLLELFSGTQSVGKVAKDLEYEVVSVDICDYKGRFPVTHKEDIMTWNYKQYPKDHFEVIWASPPCCYYSSLQYAWYGCRKKDGIFTKEKHHALMKIADGWVKKVFEIIEYFNVKKWFIENPRTGLLKKREFMEYIPYIDVDYCRYCDWGYRKQTRIWTNLERFNNKLCNNICGQIKNGKHRIDLSKDIKTTLERYRIPPNLIFELLSFNLEKDIDLKKGRKVFLFSKYK
tara:strand:- start:457 stop:1149 length:693 start_codon:yes stop_codon:yes gene_type:complete